MAWVNPSTRADGFVVTAAVWNQDVVANGLANRNQLKAGISGGYVTRSGTNLLFAPDTSNVVFCYESSVWTLKVIPDAGVTIACTGLSASTLYYLYIYDAGGGAMTLDLSTTSPTTQNGLNVKSGATSRTLLAYCYANTSGAITTYAEDAATQLVCNLYNKRWVELSVTDATATWTYTTQSWRPARNSTANSFTIVTDGRNSMRVDVDALWSATSDPSTMPAVGVGVDTFSSPSGGVIPGPTMYTPRLSLLRGMWSGRPAAGQHTLYWLEYGASLYSVFHGTDTAYGPTLISRMSGAGMF